MTRIYRGAAILLAICLSACGTTDVGLKYASPGTHNPLRNTSGIAIGRFEDTRGPDSQRLGVIRGGWGNPLKTLRLSAPASGLVEDAFRSGLQARGIVPAANAPLVLDGQIRKLDCSQYVRREAHAHIFVRVRRERDGKELFAKEYRQDEVSGSSMALDTGPFASVDDLRVVAEQALTKVVDQALDDPELRAALRR